MPARRCSLVEELTEETYWASQTIKQQERKLEELESALRLRLRPGHNDTCEHELDLNAGGELQGYACTCGHDAIAAVLSRQGESS